MVDMGSGCGVSDGPHVGEGVGDSGCVGSGECSNHTATTDFH